MIGRICSEHGAQWVTLLVFLSACSEYGFNGDLNEPKGVDTNSTTSTTGTETTVPSTLTDTVVISTDCEFDVASAGTVDILDVCEPYDSKKVKDPWDLSLEWQFSAGGSTVVTPVVGHLNGDSIPDIAFTSYSNAGTLYILSGDGSGLICSTAGFRYDGGVIIADVDGDGANEVVGPGSDGRIRAVDGNCGLKWVSAQSYNFMYPVTTAADIDGDGDVEVIADVGVVSGVDGSHVTTLTPLNTGCWRTPIAADLDQDGDQEIILGDSVFDHLGTRLWSASGTGTSCFGAVVNLDSDDEAEVVFSYGYNLQFYEHDGTLITQQSLSVPNPGPPCAGDIDGDGKVEIIAPSGTRISAYKADGTTIWTNNMQDNSGAAGCSVFDMNGDEVYEVLFADEQALRIYDGKTGTVLYQNSSHGSVTYFEYPTIADVDNDGSAEMIVANSSGAYLGITVFGHGGSGWPEAGPTWGIHDFAQSNQESSGAIPTMPDASWLEYNIFRGRPYSDKPGTPDLVVDIVDICVTSCSDTGTVYISYQVSNSGYLETEVETAVSLYGDNKLTFMDSQTVPVVSGGESLAGDWFAVPFSQLKDNGFVLRVDDSGSGIGIIEECTEDNNDATWMKSICGD